MVLFCHAELLADAQADARKRYWDAQADARRRDVERSRREEALLP